MIKNVNYLKNFKLFVFLMLKLRRIHFLNANIFYHKYFKMLFLYFGLILSVPDMLALAVE